MAAYPSERIGQGRWSTIIRPAPGILWTDDIANAGFQPAPNIDPAPVLNLLETYCDASRPVTTAFDELHAAFGTIITAGELSTWRPLRQARRRSVEA